MKVEIKQDKEKISENDILNLYHIIISPENEEDKDKFNELKKDFYFEKFFDKDNILRIIF